MTLEHLTDGTIRYSYRLDEAKVVRFPSPGEIPGPRPTFPELGGARIMAWTEMLFANVQLYHPLDDRPPGSRVLPLYDRPCADPLLAEPVIYMGMWYGSLTFSRERYDGWAPLYFHDVAPCEG